MKALKLLAPAALMLVLAAGIGRAQSATFNFEGVALATDTPFSAAAEVGGPLSATFSSTDPAGLNVGSNGDPGPPIFSSLFSNNVLVSALPDQTLTITFGAPIRGVAFDYAEDVNGTLDYTIPDLGLSGSLPTAGPNSSGFFDGSVGIGVAGLFSSLTLTPGGGAHNFGIDNLTARGIVPEPGVVALGLSALLPLGLLLRRRS